MAYEFRLPDLGEGVAEGEVARWLVEVGQTIAEDDPLVEIQTDKATVEIPSPAAGTVAAILVDEGKLVPVGTPLVVIGTGEAATDDRQDDERASAETAVTRGQTPGRVPDGQGRVQATPLVRRVAAELGVDLAIVAGSGPNSRITESDVRSAAEDVSRAQTPGPGQEGRRVPLRGVRRRIAQHLAQSHREVAAVTVVEECDFTELDRLRGERSYLGYLIHAAVEGLKAYPELNATLRGEELLLLDRYDIGVAVQTEEGLVVPVLRAAGGKSVDELAVEASRLAEDARAGRLRADELRGSTFTVTSAGRLGGLFATPLVNYPEVAILGLHRIAERPAVHDGRLTVRRIGWLSCTFDHRVVDGARAGEFLLVVIGRLERPAGD